MTSPFLICDLRPEWNSRPYVSFWRSNNAGYAYPLAWAGDYTEAEVATVGRYYTEWERGVLVRFPLARAIAEPLAGAPGRGRIDGDAGPVIVNTPDMRRHLRRFAHLPIVALPVGDSEP